MAFDKGVLSYYLAISLDGYLAREDGAVDWLDPFHDSMGTPYDYEAYFATVDALVMGRKTSDFLKQCGAEYPYGNKPGLVVTRDRKYRPPSEDLRVVAEPVREVRALVEEHRRRIWLVGGGELAASLGAAGLIDEIVLTVMPVSLGAGLRWLPPGGGDRAWTLRDHHAGPKGQLQLAYVRADR